MSCQKYRKALRRTKNVANYNNINYNYKLKIINLNTVLGKINIFVNIY